MSPISLKAHFDGKAIQLDEPYELPRDAQLLVVILPPTAVDGQLLDWNELSGSGLSRAYGVNEPDYSSTDIVP